MKRKFLAFTAAALIFASSAAAMPVITGNDTSYCVTAEAVSKLPAPKGMSYFPISEGTVRLTWDEMSGADGYVVYRYNSSSKKWEKMKSVSINFLTISNIKSGKSYYYKVAALKRSGDKYYRGNFCNYITVKYNYIAPVLSETGNVSQADQQDLLASYYKNELAVSGKNPMNAEKSKAYIANAMEYGGQVMLVEYTFKDDKKLTYAFCIVNGRVSPVGKGLIADSTMRMNQKACFVKETTGNNYYVMTEGQFSVNYYCSIGKVGSGGLNVRYNISSIYDAIFYLNGEESDYGSYLEIMENFKRCDEGKDEIVYLA